MVFVEPAAERRADVVSIEEYLKGTLADVDSILAHAIEARNRLAIRLKALAMATDDRVEEAVEDYQQRVAEKRGYDDTVTIEELTDTARKLR